MKELILKRILLKCKVKFKYSFNRPYRYMGINMIIHNLYIRTVIQNLKFTANNVMKHLNRDHIHILIKEVDVKNALYELILLI